MNWATRVINELREGKVSKCRPHGNSMKGRINSGQLVTLDPSVEAKVGDAALVRVKGNTYIHLIKAIRKNGENTEYLIGNNRGGINGWTTALYGVVVEVED